MKIDHHSLKCLRADLPGSVLALEAFPGPEGEHEPCLAFLVQDFGEACLTSAILYSFWDLNLERRELWKEFEDALRGARYHPCSVPPGFDRAILYFPDIKVGS